MTAATIITAQYLAFLAAQPSPAAAGPRVAVFNIATTFEKYQMTGDLEQLFAQRRQDIQAEAEKRRDALSKLASGLEQFKPGSADHRRRQDELMQAEIKFQVWLEVQERRLKQQHKQWLERIYQDVQKTVADVARQRGIDLVLTYSDVQDDAPDSIAYKQQILMRTVIYANQRSDLTNEIISLLDAEYQRRGGAAALQLTSTSP